MNLDNCFSNFQKALADFQTNLSARAPPPFHNALSALHQAFHGPALSPPWARVAQSIMPKPRQPMSWEAIEQRLEGVPVYALSNASEEFLLVSGASTGKNLGLFCFNEDDAQSLLRQVSAVDPRMRDGSKVVPVALNKVFQLKVNGVAFRLIPDKSQVKNALLVRDKSGSVAGSFPGVPVFQSKSLILKSQNKRYRPLFFRKEDLEKSLHRASSDQNQLNPALRPGDIQVATLEDVIKQMKVRVCNARRIR
ncbi:hypothetical protein PIB30_003824 [Stylosanthes scabra]|uniref:Protein TIC 22-like, chloroplastic n=1 Tax=Stylosanthes scabra TaxID=79078 RepID=A0ABU6S453_9FABA|nr:hypothetical protein [Stylosanthes scabra]